GLVIFAAVGHFLWWIGAQTLCGLFGGGEQDDPASPRRDRSFTTCPACRAPVEPRDDECSFCGMLLDSRAARELVRVRTAEAEVRALAEAGALDTDTAKSVGEQLERRARVIQGLPADPARPVRVPLPRRPIPAATPAPAPAPPPEPEPAPALSVI